MTNKVLIDKVNIEVSRIGFGTASLHHVLSKKNRHDILQTSIDLGITHFDTAPYYGFGLAEVELGSVLSSKRDSVTISTKVGLYPKGNSSSSILNVWAKKISSKLLPHIASPYRSLDIDRAKLSLSDSLKRMKTDFVDFLFLHEPVFGAENEDEILGWLESEKLNGTIRAWGLAGEKENILPWMNAKSNLAEVLQTRDSLDRNEANFVSKMGRNLQFTYGYFSSTKMQNGDLIARDVLSDALSRNNSGTVLISSNKPAHLKQFTGIAGD